MKLDKLEKMILSTKGTVSTKEAEAAGFHRQYLVMLVQQGKLSRVSNGVYQVQDAWEDPLYQLQLKRSKMIYSHETALFLHGLSDRDPSLFQATFPSGYNTSQIEESIQTYTIKKELLDLGKMVIHTNAGNPVIVYDKERTICDIIRSRRKIDSQIFTQGLKNYINSTDKNLQRLMNYSHQLGIANLVRSYMEILL